MRYKYKQNAIVLGMLMLFQGSSRGDTAIVVIWTPDRTIIAADSLTKLLHPPYTISSKCKIIQARDVFFTASGMTGSEADIFDIRASVTEAAKQGGNIASIAAKLESLIANPLKIQIEWLRKNAPADYEKRINSGRRVFLNVIFAGLEGGKPVLYWIEYMATHADPTPVTFKTISQNCPTNCTNVPAFVIPGLHDKIREYMGSHDMPRNQSLASIAEQLVTLEIDGIEAGHPIDVLEITKAGGKWIKRHDQCADIQNQAEHKQDRKSVPKATRKPKKSASVLRPL